MYSPASALFMLRTAQNLPHMEQEPLFRPAFLDRRIDRTPDVLHEIKLRDARYGEGASLRLLPKIMPVFGNGDAL